MGGLSIWHILILAIILLLLFGGNRFSSMMGDVAKGLKSFKKGMTEDEAAKAEPGKTEPVKTIDHQAETVAGDLKRRAETETKVEGRAV